MTEEERLWGKVEKTKECSDGYGKFYTAAQGWSGQAHRWAYEKLIGPIAAGLQIDHLCRVRRCVNPAHLEPVTIKENLRRGISHNRTKTHCPRGHLYDGSRTTQGWRKCPLCTKELNRIRQQKALT